MAKETDAIKAKLGAYILLQRRLDNQIERLVYITSSMYSPPNPQITGLPSGSGVDFDKTGRQVAKREEIEIKIKQLTADEQKLRREIEDLIQKLPTPDEQTVIEMRYLDRADWDQITSVLFGNRSDYIDRYDAYRSRAYKIHGSALQTLARFYTAQQKPT